MLPPSTKATPEERLIYAIMAQCVRDVKSRPRPIAAEAIHFLGTDYAAHLLSAVPFGHTAEDLRDRCENIRQEKYLDAGIVRSMADELTPVSEK